MIQIKRNLYLFQHAGVSDITKDIESLKKVIVNAGQAAAGSGPLVSVSKTGVRFALSSANRSK